ncbi:MAG: hypothetical protein AAGL17_18155, partial [Cyanobacteria bacterium J06576_12]
MKNLFLSALALSAATLTFAPVANAAEVFPSSIQQRRLEFLDTQTKAVENIQEARLEFLGNQTKAIENVQVTRLEFLDNQTKAIDDIQKIRLEH